MPIHLDGVIAPLIIVAGSAVFAAGRKLLVAQSRRSQPWADVAVMLAVVCLAGFLEFQMGRAPTYRHGPVRLWSGDIQSDQNSQQVFDPYSFTHVIHGAVFYGLARAVLRTAQFRTCALVVVTIEAAWEVYENTDQVINRYRAVTISLGYFGDSILNSMSDIFACIVGLLLARRLPVSVTVVWIVTVELLLAFWIRDNLTLNIIMLVHPFDAIKAWQAGA